MDVTAAYLMLAHDNLAVAGEVEEVRVEAADDRRLLERVARQRRGIRRELRERRPGRHSRR